MSRFEPELEQRNSAGRLEPSSNEELGSREVSTVAFFQHGKLWWCQLCSVHRLGCVFHVCTSMRLLRIVMRQPVHFSFTARVRLRSHRHEYESGFAFTGCLSLVQASPAWVERSPSLVQAHNSTRVCWQSPVKSNRVNALSKVASVLRCHSSQRASENN